jgi:hypothetical protein
MSSNYLGRSLLGLNCLRLHFNLIIHYNKLFCYILKTMLKTDLLYESISIFYCNTKSHNVNTPFIYQYSENTQSLSFLIKIKSYEIVQLLLVFLVLPGSSTEEVLECNQQDWSDTQDIFQETNLSSCRAARKDQGFGSRLTSHIFLWICRVPSRHTHPICIRLRDGSFQCTLQPESSRCFLHGQW